MQADISCVLCKTGADGKIALFPVGRLQKQEGKLRRLRLPFVPPLSLRCHVSVQNGRLIKTLRLHASNNLKEMPPCDITRCQYDLTRVFSSRPSTATTPTPTPPPTSIHQSDRHPAAALHNSANIDHRWAPRGRRGYRVGCFWSSCTIKCNSDKVNLHLQLYY